MYEPSRWRVFRYDLLSLLLAVGLLAVLASALRESPPAIRAVGAASALVSTPTTALLSRPARDFTGALRSSESQPAAPPLAPTAQPDSPRARDGQTLDAQPAETLRVFTAMYGSAARQRWVEEHDAELARGSR